MSAIRLAANFAGCRGDFLIERETSRSSRSFETLGRQRGKAAAPSR